MSFLCQSCSMPLETDYVLGSNEDGSKNYEYCNICYKNGKFTNQNLTLNEEIASVTIHIMSIKRISKDAARLVAENTLPKLKRWRKKEETLVLDKV